MHAWAVMLVEAVGVPVACPSGNRTGRKHDYQKAAIEMRKTMASRLQYLADALSPELRAELLEVVRRCLLVVPTWRLSAAEVLERLEPLVGALRKQLGV